MPMAVRYTTVDGQVLCENRGGVKTLFMPDTLGNVIETRNMDTGAQTSSTTYWPYGEVRTQTGTNPSPFGFCGVWGYYTQAGQPTYVRARYYRPNLGRWQTVDPLWPWQKAYAYVGGLPATFVDPTGLVYPSLAPVDIVEEWGRIWGNREKLKDPNETIIGPAKQEYVEAIIWINVNARCNVRLYCAKLARERSDRALGRNQEYERRFGRKRRDGDTDANAVSHCSSACLATRFCGRSIADEYLNGIYESGPLLGNNNDRHNNNEGIRCGSLRGPGFNEDSCIHCCIAAFADGRLRWRA